ncbi:MAG: GSCFA domain-containing protein [Paludibacteraceae bacterium]|nr:GSCFA domain-containing protein [Paludibacteraceae bacterium]
MQALRTYTAWNPAPWKMTHGDKILLAGSCFAGHMAGYLQERGWRTSQPFGPLFNPASIAAALHRLDSNRSVAADELFEEDGVWHHFDFHSAYSRPDRKEALQVMNDCVAEGHRFLQDASCLILTLGTAYIYRHRNSGAVVANCHHVPAAAFERTRLSVDETLDCLNDIRALLPGKKLILTVSPVRHLRDGLHDNNLSKSTLLLAVEAFCHRHPEADYFPAYELLNDDLRDYRFYADDLVHPAPLAVEYIGERFAECYWDSATAGAARAFMEIRKAESHRALHPGSEADNAFRERTRRQRRQWEQQYYGAT